ncbi:MAG TPA: BON domain-containing protein [Thermoanaerobaculia bacterium]|nr:BON domain-containing protein [Thermoanaerobaculia bacterium]
MTSKGSLVLAVALALGFGGLAGARADQQADWLTTAKVKLELLSKLGVDSLGVSVETANGVVVLTGEVGKRETKELADEIVRNVEGVTKVKNRIRFEAPGSDDAKVGAAVSEAEKEVKDGILESRLRIALVDRMGSDGFRIGTEAADGVVTLEFGRDLPSDRRAQAKKIAEGVEGVRKVVSIEKKD